LKIENKEDWPDDDVEGVTGAINEESALS